MQTATLNVQGMTCGHCKAAVEGAIKEVSGVSEAQADVSTGKVEVTYNEEQATVKAMQDAVEEQGYDVES